jgi:hypothetical protein
MTKVVFQQLIESQDELVSKWPRLRTVVTPEQVSLGMDALRRRVAAGDIDLQTEEAAAREAVNLYNSVIADGRYVGMLLTDPKGAAEHLGQSVSAEGAELLRRAVSLDPTFAEQQGAALSPVGEVFIIVFIAIVVAAREPEEMVVDESGLVKF